MAVENNSATRANIRIEIKNDFSEEMEVDEELEDKKSSCGEIEEGEIDEPPEVAKSNDVEANNETVFIRKIGANRIDNQWPNAEGGFTTGVDIFSKDVQEKLQTRAERFGLDPNDCKAMTDVQLRELHDSLGVSTEDDVDVRFDAIHMHGTDEMSTHDVFDYFGPYGPAFVEWINDGSCNVVWHDSVSTARAFHGLSKPIAGMPVTGECNPFKDETKTQSRSILLIKPIESIPESVDGTVHVSDIKIPIPPGYWRLGTKHPKSKFLLLRFAKRSDKKPWRAERFSEYYKKHGNPNFGGMRGLISESRKRRIRGIYVKDDSAEKEEETVDPSNPWGSLAKNWNQDVRETVDHIITEVPSVNKASKSILNRIGKRNHEPEDESSETSEEDEDTKKSKVPRMKMYADEEEDRIKRMKATKKIQELENVEQKLANNVMQHTIDLRNRLKSKTLPHISRVPEIHTKPEYVPTYSDSEEEVTVQQKSKVTVIVRKPHTPTVASTVWSRLDRERLKQEPPQSDESDSESSNNSSSHSGSTKSPVSNIKNRPGFESADLKSRLGAKNTEHKSPLRIEINNDHYSK